MEAQRDRSHVKAMLVIRSRRGSVLAPPNLVRCHPPGQVSAAVFLTVASLPWVSVSPSVQ